MPSSTTTALRHLGIASCSLAFHLPRQNRRLEARHLGKLSWRHTYIYILGMSIFNESTMFIFIFSHLLQFCVASPIWMQHARRDDGAGGPSAGSVIGGIFFLIFLIWLCNRASCGVDCGTLLCLPLIIVGWILGFILGFIYECICLCPSIRQEFSPARE